MSDAKKKSGFGLFKLLERVRKTIQPSGVIESFEIVALHTSGMRHVTDYEIVTKEGKAEVSPYAVGYRDGEEERHLEKRAVCEEAAALKLLNECRLLSWDGFRGPHPKGVEDGTMFTFKATVNGGKEIRAAGSQNFPRHYRDFTNGLYKILNGETAAQNH